jgi:hypothetical protein
MSLTKFSLAWNNLIIPRGSSVSDIPASDGKIVNLFLQCIDSCTQLRSTLADSLTEAEFLDVIGTKVLRVFLLAIYSHLY